MANIKLWFKQNSPAILTSFGILNSAVAVILTAYATRKLPAITEPAKKEIIKFHKKIEKVEENSTEHKELKKELNKFYLKTGLKCLKLYVPSIISFGLSVGSIIGSHQIQKSRNLALAAAFTTLKGGYDAYRSRVKDKLGDDVEQEIYEGYTKEKVTEISDDGKKKVTNVKISQLDESRHKEQDFGIMWGPGNREYDRNIGTRPRREDLNISTLNMIETWCNQVLQAEGFLFLHDVYARLGVTQDLISPEKMQAAHILGWIYDPEDKSRDSYVSFGFHDADGKLTEAAKNFQNGWADFIWLEFNVDGDILTGNNKKRVFAENKDDYRKRLMTNE